MKNSDLEELYRSYNHYFAEIKIHIKLIVKSGIIKMFDVCFFAFH